MYFAQLRQFYRSLIFPVFRHAFSDLFIISFCLCLFKKFLIIFQGEFVWILLIYKMVFYKLLRIILQLVNGRVRDLLIVIHEKRNKLMLRDLDLAGLYIFSGQ